MMSANQPQGLLKRHPSLTRAQFSEYWLHTQARLTLAYMLASGCVYYAQIHNPVLASPDTAPADLDMEHWDGAAELVFAQPVNETLADPEVEKMKRKQGDFFRRFVVPDEKRFIVDEARKQVRWLEPGTVVGDIVVIIKDGSLAVGDDRRPVLDIIEGMRLWEEWVVEAEENKIDDKSAEK